RARAARDSGRLRTSPCPTSRREKAETSRVSRRAHRASPARQRLDLKVNDPESAVDLLLAVGGRHAHLYRLDFAVGLGANDELRILVEILQPIEAVLLLVRQRGPVVVREKVVLLSPKPLQVGELRRQLRSRSLSQDFLD